MRKLFPLFLMLIIGCYRGSPSEDPPIHINPNMDDQPKYKAQAASEFFKDGSAMRMPEPGTVARGDLREDEAYYQGKNTDGTLVAKMPVKITLDLLKRGQERFNIYCSPCHDRTGSGQGIVVKKGFLPPPSFHLDRLREAPDGHFFDVMSHGLRNMPAYNHQVQVADRWAIVAYIRALQRSEHASKSDVPGELINQIN